MQNPTSNPNSASNPGALALCTERYSKGQISDVVGRHFSHESSLIISTPVDGKSSEG